MEKDEAPTKLSGRARKQKLMEYLARKGRQNAPDPRSYLQQSSTNSKKLTDTFVKPPTSIRGKENQSDPPRPKPVVTSARPAGGTGRTSLQAAGSSYAASSTRTCATARCSRHSAADQLTTHPHTVRSPTASHPKTASNSTANPDISCPARDTRQPAGLQSATRQPAGRQSAARQPAGLQSAARQPAGLQSAARQPAGLQSAARQPAGLQSAARQPAGLQSAARQPAGLQSAARQPAGLQSAARQPAGRQSAARQPAGRQSAARQPAGRQSAGPLDRRTQNTAVGQPNTTVMAPTVPGSKLSKPDLALDMTRLRPFNDRKALPKPALPRVRQPAESGPGAKTGSRARITPLARGRQSGPAEPRSEASALHRVVQQAVAGLDRKVGCRVVPPHVDGARNGTLAASRVDRVPVTSAPGQGRRKLTTAQEERLQKLQEWREAKGISYKRPPMPMRPCRKKEVDPPCYWPTMEKEDEVHRLVSSIDSSLTDCMQLLEEGCPTERVTELLSRLPMAHKFAKYWMCQARILEREGNLEVLPLFEEAVRVVLEPVDELRTMIYEILKKKEAQTLEAETGEQTDLQDGAQEKSGAVPVTPRATSVLIRGAKGGSSVVKYKITATPGAQKCQQQEPMHLDGQELRFFTPVRRSVRIERSVRRYPSALREHDPCVTSLRDLLAEKLPEGRESLYIYRENEALGDQVQLQFRSPDAL
ncbi:cytoskeleton-associated protein 2-like isoform X2 [Brienomyrus brachyistius]|uniref:cytoskeleton-associated protein 2-like isoform X2 n=1 Tax=Brienomyrus brachyistius TaxID=42636 RepID=UPI0020B2996E|nr:cytoskeleton-associated protein 2-like isoform X2 [Brienomyrus brachyistius]